MSSNTVVSPAVPTSPIAAAVQATGTPIVNANDPAAAAAALVTVPGVPSLALPEVVTLLKSAGEAQKTVYDGIRKAAALACVAMSPNLSAPEKVKQIQAIYAGVLAEINDNNVRATFSSFLWIHAAPTVKVEIPAIPKAGETKSTQLVDAAAALTVAKATMHDVATQIRQMHDAGRKEGGGRKANVPAASVASAPTVVNTPAAAAPTFFDTLEVRMNDAGDFAKIVAAVERRGYTVTRKVAVTPAPTSTPADSTTGALAAALTAALNAETMPTVAKAAKAAKAAK